MVVEVIINRNAKQINRTFDYIVPKEMSKYIFIGARVFVPFGNSKKVEAFIVNIKEKSAFATKEISSLEDNILTEDNIKLANLMANRYFCSVSDCIKLMLPPGDSNKKIENRIKDKLRNVVYLNEDKEFVNEELQKNKIKNEKQIRVLKFLLENDEILATNLMELTDSNIYTLRALEKKNYIKILEKKVERDPISNKSIAKDKKLKLTSEQDYAYNQICQSIEKKENKEFLLYGVTGSRKNRSIFTSDRKSIRTR